MVHEGARSGAAFRSLRARTYVGFGVRVGHSAMSARCPVCPKDGVIGLPACGQLKILGAALQPDTETRYVNTTSSIRRRSAAWTILLDWTFRSRRRASALWMTQARSFGK